MSNIIDYMVRVKDISFESMPFNEIDGLIFSQLAYLNYDILPNKEGYSFSEICTSSMIQQLVSRTWNADNNRILLSEIAKSGRYKSIKIFEPVNLLCEEEEKQFAAVTFELPNNHYFLAFRGSSSTFVAWKEDLNMSYLKIIPSQKSAAEYLESIHDKFGGKYYLGGHSKGGTLAVFAGVFSKYEIKKEIVEIYNHDGPGIHSILKTSIQYQEMKNKIRKIVPDSSVVGIILEEEQDFSVVKSSAWTVMQHDPYTWIINEDKFLQRPSTTRLSYYTQRTVLSWMNTLDAETKKTCLASLYEITKSMDAVYFTEAVEQWPKNIKVFMKGVKNMDKNIKKEWFFVITTLIKVSMREGVHTIKREIIQG